MKFALDGITGSWHSFRMSEEKIVLGSPNTIEVLLHCHVSPEAHPRAGAPAVDDALSLLFSSGAIEYAGSKVWKTTRLGAAWVRALGKVPVPTTAFIDEQGRVL